METNPKEVLLKRDPGLENRPYQLEALLSIFLYAKCLVKMFCGTGKSRIITNVIIHEKKGLSVVVFPSLALISQYSADYLNNEEYARHFKKHKTMNVSSEKLDNMESTTDTKEIKNFLKYKNPKIILVTYQSYQVLLDCLEGKKIGLVCYDEAHHVVSPETQKLVFGTAYYEKEVFFTATPKNENGITMFDRDDIEKNMCGPVAYDYTYLQGLMDEVLNAFEICIDMYTENTNASIYEAMARAILAKGTSRVLSFHSGVNGESNTNVWNFVNEPDFQIAFEKVQKAEFLEKAGYYTKITFKGMDGNTPSAERKSMLSALDDTPNNEIYIIASCETIGEGVDTKKANMCLFADPKSSITKIIQNIGRVVRRNNAHPLSTILIPCWVNMENYASANGDRAKQDELIRQQMRSEKGDYASILNVLGALRQEDPELYEMCLDYPNRREDGSEAEDDEESVSESDTVSEADTEPDSVSEAETDSASETEDRRQPKRIRMSIHQNDAIQMLWRVKGELDFSQKFCSVVIECEVSYGVEKWKQNLEKVKAYIDEHEKRPSHCDKDDTIAFMARWINTQKTKYNVDIRKSKQIMISKPEIHTLWTETINDKKYNEYLSFDINSEWINVWKYKLQCVKTYIDENYKCPSAGDKNPEIKSIGTWLVNQRLHYDEDITKSTNTMTQTEIHSLWTCEINDPKYRKYFWINLNEKWKGTLNDVKNYIDIHKKRPTESVNDKNIKYMGRWITHQKKNYTFRKGSFIDETIYALWTDTINNPKYQEYLCNNEDFWKIVLSRVKKYMDTNKTRPSCKSKDDNIKFMGQWIINQKGKYNTNRSICIGTMNNKDIHDLWTQLINDSKYKEYLIDAKDVDIRIEKWKQRFEDVKNYIDLNKKAPPNNDENEEIKSLAGWIGTQKKSYNVDIRQSKLIMKEEEVHNLWTAIINDPKYEKYFVIDIVDTWKQNLQKLKKYITDNKKNPSIKDENDDIKYLSHWWTDQKQNYKKCTGQMKNPEIYALWTDFINEPKPKLIRKKKQTAIPIATATETTTPHHFPPPSEIGLLHKTYLKMRSDTLNAKFKSEPQLWREYHATRKRNFASYDPASIPSNQIIRELEKIQTKRRKVVVDMGCGEAPIAHHFLAKNDNRFTFHNYDHQSGGDPLIQEVDISALPLDDADAEIAIMSLALWGTHENCVQYIKEAYRILESGGKFYISDSTKKWSPENPTQENGGELLRTLLITNGFKIINETIGTPFCFFECNKIY